MRRTTKLTQRGEGEGGGGGGGPPVGMKGGRLATMRTMTRRAMAFSGTRRGGADEAGPRVSAGDLALAAAANVAVAYVNPASVAEKAAAASASASGQHGSVSAHETVGAAAEGKASITNDGKVLLGEATIRNTRALLDRKANAMASILGSGDNVQSYTAQIFAAGALKFLEATKTIPPQMLSDFEVFVLPIISTNCDQEIERLHKPWSAVDRDTLFLGAVGLFVSTLREVIQSEGATGSAVCRHKIFGGTAQSIRPLLTKFLKDSNSITGDKIDTSLLDWLRIISGYGNDEFLRVTKNAKAVATKDLAFWSITQYQMELKEAKDRGHDLQHARFEDFKIPEDFIKFLLVELKTVEQWIRLFQICYPHLKTDQQFPRDAENVFLPHDREKYYKLILQLCLSHDMKADKGASLNLSKSSTALLSEIAFRWHLTKEWRELAHMEAVLGLYGDKVLSFNEVTPKLYEFMDSLNKRISTSRYSEDSFYIENLRRMNFYCIGALSDFTSLMASGREAANKQMQAYAAMYLRINEDTYWKSANMADSNLINSVERTIDEVAYERYSKFQAQFKPDEDLNGLLNLVKWISDEIDKFYSNFPDKVYGRIVIGDVVEKMYMNHGLVAHLDSLQYDFDKNKDRMDLVLGADGLYAAVSDLYGKLDRTIVGNVDIEEWFRPFIEQWLELMKNDWSNWARNAIANDTYAPILPPLSMFSSSIRDVFGFFNNGLRFMKKLKDGAANDRRREALVVSFLRVMGRSIMAFAEELYREFEELSIDVDGKPVDFTRQQCVKLNNVIAAIKQLDNVFNELNIKKGGDRINSNAVRYEPDPNFVTVAVTVVRAFDLPLVDSISADPFVRLIQNGQQVNSNTATKVIRRNLNPVWNEKWEFGVPLQYSRDAFDFEVCNEDNFGLASSKVIGKTRIQDGVSFNDRIFQDYLTHEMTFNLEPKGQLVVRVLRKGEIDDREFWVQKSMETLRFTAEKMIRVFTDKIVRFAEVMWTRISQQYKLSNSILGGLVGSKKDAAPVKDIEVEAALTPLLEYLDNNLTTFNENLDRLQLDRFLTDIYHYLGTDQASLKVETVDLTDFEAMSLNEASLDKPSLMALVVWHELVIRMNSSLGALHASGRAALAKSNPGGFTGKEPLGESEKRQVAALELVLEYLKAFFYCDLDGRCCGFPLKVLERGKYRDTRFLIESMLR